MLNTGMVKLLNKTIMSDAAAAYLDGYQNCKKQKSTRQSFKTRHYNGSTWEKDQGVK